MLRCLLQVLPLSTEVNSLLFPSTVFIFRLCRGTLSDFAVHDVIVSFLLVLRVPEAHSDVSGHANTSSQCPEETLQVLPQLHDALRQATVASLFLCFLQAVIA